MIRSMTKWCLVSVLVTVTLAISSHPFVGKNAEETMVKRDDGSVAMKMNQTPSKYNKFSSLINRKLNFNRPRSTS